MDYFGAQAYLTSQFLGGLARLFGRRVARWFALPLFLGFTYHVLYLTVILPRFDYGYNMIVMITMGLLNCMCWLMWCWKNRRDNPHASIGAITIVAVLLTSLLEVLEFEPLWHAIDSHALWHISTIPMSYSFFEFVRRDSLHHHRCLKAQGRDAPTGAAEGQEPSKTS